MIALCRTLAPQSQVIQCLFYLYASGCFLDDVLLFNEQDMHVMEDCAPSHESTLTMSGCYCAERTLQSPDPPEADVAAGWTAGSDWNYCNGPGWCDVVSNHNTPDCKPKGADDPDAHHGLDYIGWDQCTQCADQSWWVNAGGHHLVDARDTAWRCFPICAALQIVLFFVDAKRHGDEDADSPTLHDLFIVLLQLANGFAIITMLGVYVEILEDGDMLCLEGCFAEECDFEIDGDPFSGGTWQDSGCDECWCTDVCESTCPITMPVSDDSMGDARKAHFLSYGFTMGSAIHGWAFPLVSSGTNAALVVQFVVLVYCI